MPKKPADMVEVLFRGPTHRLEAFGRIVKRGESALFTEAQAYALRSERRIQIDVLGPHEPIGAAAPEPAAVTGEGQPARFNDTKE